MRPSLLRTQRGCVWATEAPAIKIGPEDPRRPRRGGRCVAVQPPQIFRLRHTAEHDVRSAPRVETGDEEAGNPAARTKRLPCGGRLRSRVRRLTGPVRNPGWPRVDDDPPFKLPTHAARTLADGLCQSSRSAPHALVNCARDADVAPPSRASTLGSRAVPLIQFPPRYGRWLDGSATDVCVRRGGFEA